MHTYKCKATVIIKARYMHVSKCALLQHSSSISSSSFFFLFISLSLSDTHTGQMQSNLSQAAEPNQSMLRDLWGVISC